jgi:hypothetical protein
MILAAKMPWQQYKTGSKRIIPWLPCFKFTSCTLYVALLCSDTTELTM